MSYYRTGGISIKEAAEKAVAMLKEKIRNEAGEGAKTAVAPVARAEAAKGAREAVTPMVVGVGAVALTALFIALKK